MDIIATIALAVSIATALGALAGHLASARKSDVEALRAIIAELRERIQELEAENERLRRRVEELEAENRRLKDDLAKKW